MRYEHIVFDVDGTLLDTEEAVLLSFQRTLEEELGIKKEKGELSFSLGIPGQDALRRLGIEEEKVKAVLEAWMTNMEQMPELSAVFEGITQLLDGLKKLGITLGVVTSRIHRELESDPAFMELAERFETIICAEDACRPKPDGAPLLRYMELMGADAGKVLYIGDSIYDMECAAHAGVDGALALWGCSSVKHIRAAYYLPQPGAVLNLLDERVNPFGNSRWIAWAVELQFIAQAGLTYSKDRFDQERFARVRELAGEIMEQYTDMDHDKITSLFCSETGFQTPKLDTRAAVFQREESPLQGGKNGKILLVRERDGRWSLPGGWVDVNQTIGQNAVKEVKEEAGLDVAAVRLIAIQDRNLHNTPPYAYGVTKVFLLCEVVDGVFEKNIETDESRYFGREELPELAEEKITRAQVEMCFGAWENPHWVPVFD